MGKNHQENEVTGLLNEPIAIIGMNCQFPGIEVDVEDIESFYDMLLNRQSPIKEVPKNRWNIDEYYDAEREKADKIVGRKGGFLNDPHLFDASFFKISSVEAKQMDPQHRLFLEVAIRALNHANIPSELLSGSNTGVFCGTSAQDYSQLNYKDNIEFNAYTLIGAATSAAAGRLSHFLNLKGPSLAVDTACSSSFAALYLAVTALRTEQCSMAIVGGVHLNLCPENFIGLTKANMLSATDCCRSFDEHADGFVRSEGCGVVIIKRLRDAIKDNDTIHAVLKSVVMNQDGDDGTALVAPNIQAQIAMHQAALNQAQLLASDIHYLETHGTGTVVGDSVEFNAIKSIHQGLHSAEEPLVLGALKSTLGHSIASSGVASLIKAVCALKREVISPNLHYSAPNKAIDPESIPSLFPQQIIPFTRQADKKRYVQITNFGFSGTNVSAIIEEAPLNFLNHVSTDEHCLQCFVLSAKSKASLKHMLANYVSFLRTSAASLHDICATLINGRDQYKFRCAILAHNKEELVQKIQAQNYELKKVTIKKDPIIRVSNAQQIYDSYLSGALIQLALNTQRINKVDLPLYFFDRQPYWHDARSRVPEASWLPALYRQSKEEQIEAIKAKIAEQIRILLQQDNQANLEEHVDLAALGLTQDLLEKLDQILYDLFGRQYTMNSASFLTLDKLARHLQSVMMPPLVCKQPVVNILHDEPIAIIGMSCRYPRAANLNEFLTLLEQGKSGMVDIPIERWDNEKFYDPDVNVLGRLYIKQLGLIEHIKNFDADFFNISPREAKLMSPQLRVFMETSYHALENANLSLPTIKGSKTGVFVGCGTNEYPRLLAGLGVSLEDLNIYFATGNVLNALPGRVAYSFDFNGPIQAIDTACSSSMTAIHNACLSLQSGDCDMALAGGVNILLAPDSNITLSKARMLSPESRCKTFSDDADGYARSEGCGVVVLKRLSTAIKDNDTILAVIKGSSINSDGKSGGFTVPNGAAQEEVIRSALAKAKLEPADIDFIEAHGTGTPLADPIEANTLIKIFGESHTKEHPLYLSSVKTNIGHAESASGVAGVIKAVLSLQTRRVFKHLNFKKLNPEIELINAVIPLETAPWPSSHDLRCAGVSSFGFSGANAHVVLQEAPARTKEPRTLPAESLLLISAKSKPALELLLASYCGYLSQTTEEFADICYTSATCRTHFLYRVAIRAHSAQEAAALINAHEYTVYQVKKERKTKQQLTTLLQVQAAYQIGFVVRWEAFYHALHTPFYKVTLPLYEFARTEHWFEEKDKIKDAPMPKDWCFQLQWQLQDCTKSNRKIQGRNWLLVGASPLAPSFKAQDLRIFLEDEPYQLERLEGIIFAEGLAFTAMSDLEASFEFQKHCIKKLLNLIKELCTNKIKLQLIILTTNAIPELATQTVNLSNSPLLGFCKTLVLEQPQFQTILIDLDKIESALDLAPVLDEINYNHGAHYEHTVAYREGKRWVSRFMQTSLVDRRRSLYGEGRYLITGGCGGLGLVTAQALLSAGAREVVLASRTIDTPAIIEAIKRMRSNYTGRLIKPVSLDITDKEKLGALLTELNADGQLKGIIHAAGAGVKAALLEHHDNDVDYVFAAKVKGGWYLHELSKSLPLDFFVAYSSVASALGSNKESVYSASNSFIDALIAERQRLGLVGTAIQWGPWGEVGMAKGRSQGQSLKQSLIANDQGQTLIKILLTGQLNHATIISPDYLKFMLDFVPTPMPALHQHLAASLVSKNAQSVHQTSLHAGSWLTDYQATLPENRLQRCKTMLGEVCKEILGVAATADLDDDEGFFELGFDSLMMTEMASRLKNKLEPALKVAVNIGFDYPSINKLAQYIASELEQNFSQQPGILATAKPQDDSIAIIGMSCVLPNAPDIAAFEAMLEQGLSGMKEIPLERWDNRKYYDPDMDAPGKSYVNKLGLIEQIKCFDANFFGISPREAKLLEPQQRIFLQCAYKALEHANYPAESLRGTLTGVFAGVGPNEYYAQLEKSGFSNEELSVYSITGNVLNLIPGRVAYTFDLKGPSISVDTACSSSMVAVHYACQSLKNHEIDYALAGGVNILLMPESNITLCRAKALSPEGLCKTFDERADGYARSEGCGVIFLKRLADAIQDKDTILAVIKASAVNNDGKSAGLTVPNGKSQEEVMLKALSQTDLKSNDISYIEAHGTGTPLGDPIEVGAINQVYNSQRMAENPLYLGTVKTNIGHLESASGVAGIIKTVLGLRNKKIYKHLNFHKLNPNIKLNNAQIPLHTIDWDTKAKLRCAGVNAFGFSGTNAHVILQEFPAPAAARSTHPVQAYALVLSAKSPTALTNLAQCYQHYLATTADAFGDICFTAATCREHYRHRLVLMADGAVNASKMLAEQQFALSQEQMHILALSHDVALKSVLTSYLEGKTIDWNSYYKTQDSEFSKVQLPNYVFELQEFWLDKKPEYHRVVDELHPLLGQMVSMPGNEYLFTHTLNLHHLSYINQHRVFDKVIFPATAYIETGLAAARILFKRHVFSLEKFVIERPLYPQQDQEFQLQVKPRGDGQFKLNIFAQQDDNWQLFSEMELHSAALELPESVDLEVLKSFFQKGVDVSQIYEHFSACALFYGEEFQVLQEGYVKSDAVLTKVVLSKASHEHNYYHHPVLLDGAMQSILLLGMNQVEASTYVPYAFTRMVAYQQAPRTFWVYLTKRPDGSEHELCVDLKLYTHTGQMLGKIDGLKLRRVTRSNFISYESKLSHLYLTKWTMILPKIAAQADLPEFLVISRNAAKAHQLLGSLNYLLVPDARSLGDLEGKHLIFLFEQGQFYELFHFCQKMIHVQPDSFILITENAYAIDEQDQVNPYHTMVSAFWKTLRNELEFARNYLIDINETSVLVATLKYLFYTNATENQLAIRGSIYLPRLKKKQLSANLVQKEQLFDENAYYLITGGTGALAKLLLEYLINRGAKWIALTSSSPCPEELNILIEQFKEKHLSIKHYVADGSNYQQMERVIAELRQDVRPLKGVFHLAGIVQDGLIVNLNDTDMQNVLNAKMDSALILHQLTKDIPLEQFVLFSSSASILGARGQANYAAANGFLDGLAHLRQKQGLPAIAINWGPFDALGMTAKLTAAMQQHGFMPLSRDSIECLDVLLPSQLPQIALCPINWELYFKYVPKQAWLSELIKPPVPQDQYFLNSLRQRSKEERVRRISDALYGIVAEVMALDETHLITAKEGLFALGLDSLMALDIRNRIHDTLQCPNLNLSIEYFINDPSIEKIARNIADELQGILLEPLDNPVPAPAKAISEEIAVCDFQYIFWVLNTLKYSFNIGMQVQLHGKLNQEYVTQALDYVVSHNSAFWIHFNEEIPTQISKKQGQFTLNYYDISLNNEPNKLLSRAFRNNMMELIPLTQQPLIRVSLYQINKDLHELHLVIPHIIVDDTSCELVFSAFKHCYELLTLKKQLTPVVVKDSYLNYVQLNNNHYEKNLNAKIDFWRAYNKEFKMLSFGKHHHLPDAANQPKNLFHYTLNAEAVKKFISWHQERNINVSTGLIAACQIVFYKLSQQNKIPVILIHSGRAGSQYKYVVGLFSEYKRINLTLNLQGRFIDCLKHIEEELVKTAVYQSCSHFIKNKGFKGEHFSLRHYLEFLHTKFTLGRRFKESKLNPTILDYYLEYLSQMIFNRKNVLRKIKLNRWLNLKLPLQKPDRLRVLLSVTPSFFAKAVPNMSFANLEYSFPAHFDCMDRPVGNQTLWVYFSKNQEGAYQLSINGPLTSECKKQIGIELNKLIAQVVLQDQKLIQELIK